MNKEWIIVNFSEHKVYFCSTKEETTQQLNWLIDDDQFDLKVFYQSNEIKFTYRRRAELE